MNFPDSTAELKPTSYEGVTNDLCDARNWVHSLGVRTRNCRYERHLSTIVAVDRAWKAGVRSQDQLPVGFEATATAFVEALQLIRIWKGSCGLDNSFLRKRLKRAVSGPILPGHELSTNASNDARNVAFELELLATLRPGTATAQLADEVDLIVEDGGIRFFIECKRPFSPRGIRDALDEAGRKLEHCLKATGLVSYGIVGLSVGKPDWSSGPIVRALNQDDLEMQLTSWFDSFDRRHVNPWLRREPEPRMGGVLLHLAYVAALPEEPLVAGVRLMLLTRYTPETRRWADFRRLSARIQVSRDL